MVRDPEVFHEVAVMSRHVNAIGLRWEQPAVVELATASPRAALHLLDAPRGFYDHFVRDALREWAWQEAPLFRADLPGVHRGVDRVATLALHDGRPALAPQKGCCVARDSRRRDGHRGPVEAPAAGGG